MTGIARTAVDDRIGRAAEQSREFSAVFRFTYSSPGEACTKLATPTLSMPIGIPTTRDAVGSGGTEDEALHLDPLINPYGRERDRLLVGAALDVHLAERGGGQLDRRVQRQRRELLALRLLHGLGLLSGELLDPPQELLGVAAERESEATFHTGHSS